MEKRNKPKPEWLRVKLSAGGSAYKTRQAVKGLSLHTVCEEAACPNIGECFGRGTATFMILGSVCTRNCTFCNVSPGTPAPVDPGEPGRVAEAAAEMGLSHVVVTSVTRDDLPDGGAGHFAEVIKKLLPLGVTVEVLIPDFMGDRKALCRVAAAGPHVINHNIETVFRLYPEIRPEAAYERSLALLSSARAINPKIRTKSGIMLGLGESRSEVESVLSDLRTAGCELLTIGQYLAPSLAHHPVAEYVKPSVFDELKAVALEKGFLHVASAPLVRSSYRAEEAVEKAGG